jgi:hypothetical protein
LSVFVISEARLAKRVGVPRLRIKTWRELTLQEGCQWAKVDGEVRLTNLAAIEALAHVGFFPAGCPRHAWGIKSAEVLAHATASPSLPVVADAADVPALEVLRCERATKNRRVIEAWRDVPTPGAELVRVSVHDSRNFCEGMRFRARHVEEDLWELVGRCPRSRRENLMADSDSHAEAAEADEKSGGTA